MSAELQKRYERLLRWYPAAYRRERGAEMLDVLMESGPRGQRRALILGGLRMRAGVAAHMPTWQSWRSALRAAAVMVLILRLAGDNNDLLTPGLDFDWVDAGKLAFGLLALVAVLRGWYAVGLGSAAAVAAIGALPVVRWGDHETALWISPWLVVALLVPLVGHGGPARLPRSLRVQIVLSLVPAGLWVAEARADGPFFANLARASWWVLLAVAAVWAVVDGLPVLAVGLVLLHPVVFELWRIATSAPVSDDWSWIPVELGTVLILPVLGMTLGGVVARRRARL